MTLGSFLLLFESDGKDCSGVAWRVAKDVNFLFFNSRLPLVDQDVWAIVLRFQKEGGAVLEAWQAWEVSFGASNPHSAR